MNLKSIVFQTLLLCIHFFIHQLIILMDFNQTCVSSSPMHALPVILFSA